MSQGNLLLMPRRVVFEGSKRYEELNLANTGRDTARYVISLMHVRMKENGGFEEIQQPDSGENFADKFVRFFPHSVMLGPDESQVVKIQLTKTNELTPGEYRSHIYFRAIPSTPPLGEKQPVQDTTISIRLVPVFGISIPVIIRVGESTTKVSLSDLSLERTEDQIPVLNLTFRRTGNMSVYGDLKVDFVPVQGKVIQVGEIKGIAVYTPGSTRKIKITLATPAGVDYKKGKLHVTYSSPEDAKPVKLAETELALLSR
jgi:hypothetical protein